MQEPEIAKFLLSGHTMYTRFVPMVELTELKFIEKLNFISQKSFHPKIKILIETKFRCNIIDSNTLSSGISWLFFDYFKTDKYQNLVDKDHAVLFDNYLVDTDHMVLCTIKKTTYITDPPTTNMFDNFQRKIIGYDVSALFSVEEELAKEILNDLQNQNVRMYEDGR